MKSSRFVGGPADSSIRYLADQMFSRASGAHLREGNCVRLLKDAAENYPAWLQAIRAAERTVHVEMYILHNDEQGQLFSDALIAKARQGVHVRVLYDWLGGVSTSWGFWRALRNGGVDVRCYNPPHFDSPIGWVSRDHRKMIAVDRTVGFVTGLCIGAAWTGNPKKGIEPWRDTGVEVRGPAVADIEDAFAEAWEAAGDPLTDDGERVVPDAIPASAVPPGAVGDVALRIVATVPYTGGLFRVDQLVAALARKSLWLSDAYFAGTAPYVQALQAAARDGVDVRLLVPGGSDVPPFVLLTRAGYRPLLEAGVRVFEWNGSMMHAKTAVADSRWARVGSTNLNIASWIGNRELDAIVENETFAHQMEAMFEDDLAHSTEVVLSRNRVRASTRRTHGRRWAPGGSGNRAVAGAIRLGRTVSAAVANRRVLEPVEAHIALIAAGLFTLLAFLAYKFPRVMSVPIGVFAAWAAAALLFRGVKLLRERRRERLRAAAEIVAVGPADRRPSDLR